MGYKAHLNITPGWDKEITTLQSRPAEFCGQSLPEARVMETQLSEHYLQDGFTMQYDLEDMISRDGCDSIKWS